MLVNLMKIKLIISEINDHFFLFIVKKLVNFFSKAGMIQQESIRIDSDSFESTIPFKINRYSLSTIGGAATAASKRVLHRR